MSKGKKDPVPDGIPDGRRPGFTQKLRDGLELLQQPAENVFERVAEIACKIQEVCKEASAYFRESESHQLMTYEGLSLLEYDLKNTQDDARRMAEVPAGRINMIHKIKGGAKELPPWVHVLLAQLISCVLTEIINQTSRQQRILATPKG